MAFCSVLVTEVDGKEAPGGTQHDRLAYTHTRRMASLPRSQACVYFSEASQGAEPARAPADVGVGAGHGAVAASALGVAGAQRAQQVLLLAGLFC